jgi:hypothetical protein
MTNEELDKLREDVIEKIKRAFPKHWQPKGKSKLTRDGYSLEARPLKEALEGKTWQNVIGNPHTIDYLSEVDFMDALTDRAYAYYLPAFLVATVNEPDRWIFYSFVLEEIVQIAQKSSAAKVEALGCSKKITAQFDISDSADEACLVPTNGQLFLWNSLSFLARIPATLSARQ